MGRHLDALRSSYDGGIPAELWAGAEELDQLEAAGDLSAIELHKLQVRLGDLTYDVRYALDIIRTRGRAPGSRARKNWLGTFFKRNALRRQARRELAALTAPVQIRKAA